MRLYFRVLFKFHNYSVGLRSLNKFTLSSLRSKKSENKIVSSWRLCLGLDLNTVEERMLWRLTRSSLEFTLFVTNNSITVSSALAE